MRTTGKTILFVMALAGMALVVPQPASAAPVYAGVCLDYKEYDLPCVNVRARVYWDGESGDITYFGWVDVDDNHVEPVPWTELELPEPLRTLYTKMTTTYCEERPDVLRGDALGEKHPLEGGGDRDQCPPNGVNAACYLAFYESAGANGPASGGWHGYTLICMPMLVGYPLIGTVNPPPPPISEVVRALNSLPV